MTFQFVISAVRSMFMPDRFEFIFAGHEIWKLEVYGRSLRAVYDRISEHRLRRIRTRERDFGEDDGKPVITKIVVTDPRPK